MHEWERGGPRPRPRLTHRLLVEVLLLREGGAELAVLVAERGQVVLDVPQLLVGLGELRREKQRGAGESQGGLGWRESAGGATLVRRKAAQVKRAPDLAEAGE